MDKVLVLNVGSSSLKFQVMDMDTETVLAKGLCDRIGSPGSVLKYQRGSHDPALIEQDMPDHFTAISLVVDTLTSPSLGILAGLHEITAVGHRASHGGETFRAPVLIDESVLALIQSNEELAPLHTRPILLGMEACRKLMPNTPMTAVFDTAFHHTMPPKAYIYSIPYEDYTDLRVRRYGFHGTSHCYVANRAAARMGKPIDTLKIVTCHLGNGASICAVSQGRSVDTSMGFTPLEGVPMGTRSGTIDPALPLYLMQKKGFTPEELGDYLQKSSGVLGISGSSNDFRDLHASADAGDMRAKLALEVFAYSIRKYVGAYAAAMEGVDCVVFTGGIGENDTVIREMAVSGLDFMGLSLDTQANRTARGEACISIPGSRAEIWVIPTDEELVIARDALHIAQSI